MSEAVAAIDTAIVNLARQGDQIISIIAALVVSKEQIQKLGAPAVSPNPVIEKESESKRKPAAARAAKNEKDAPAKKHRMGRKEYTREDVIEIAVALIRKNGPQKAREITKQVLAIFPQGKTPVSVHLSDEQKKIARRITRNDDGLWEVTKPVRQVDVKRSPEEIKEAFAQAKANADRPITSDIRA